MSGTPEEAYSLVKPPGPEIMHIVQSGMEKLDQPIRPSAA
jgi:hypothetical protein